MWAHVLEFLPPLVMLRLFQTCRAFCALKRDVRTLDFGGTPIVQEANALTALRLILGSAALVTLDLSYTQFCSTLESLDLSSNQLCGHGNGTCTDVGIIKALAEALLVSSALKELVLYDNYITDAGASAIGQGLKDNKTLEELHLGSCSIGPAGTQGLAEGVFSSALKRLVLNDNMIGDEGAAALGARLKENKSLEELELYDCKIGTAGAQGLAEGLFSSALTSLNLSDNRIGVPGAKALAGALKVSSALKNLNLAWNVIRPTGAAALAESLKVSSALEKVNVSHNELNEGAALSIIKAARQQDKMEVLELAACGIGPGGAAEVADYISFSSALKILDLAFNLGIKGDSAQQLAAAALESKTLEVFSTVPIKKLREDKLTELDLSHEILGPAEAIVLAELVKFSSALTNLNLSGNDIGPTGAAALAEALKVSSALKKLVLDKNMIGDEGAAALGASLKENKSLEELELYDCKIGAAGAQGLAEGLFSSALTYLDLSLDQLCGLWNGEGTYTDVGIKALAEAFKVSSALTNCNLLKNDIDVETATTLAKIGTEKHILLSGMQLDQTEADFAHRRLGPGDAILIASDLAVRHHTHSASHRDSRPGAADAAVMCTDAPHPGQPKCP